MPDSTRYLLLLIGIIALLVVAGVLILRNPDQGDGEE